MNTQETRALSLNLVLQMLRLRVEIWQRRNCVQICNEVILANIFAIYLLMGKWVIALRVGPTMPRPPRDLSVALNLKCGNSSFSSLWHGPGMSGALRSRDLGPGVGILGWERCITCQCSPHQERVTARVMIFTYAGLQPSLNETRPPGWLIEMWGETHEILL